MSVMKIYGMKCREVMACAGSWALIAEAEVELKNGEEVYVTLQKYNGVECTVSKESVYAFLAEDGEEPASEFVEEYTSLKEAKASKYADVFKVLNSMLGKLGKVG